MNLDSDELLRAKLNAETGRLGWKELERHFARGAVIKVAPGVDLVDAALAIARDDKATIETWLAAGRISRASSEDAIDWHGRDALFWAVVTAPWVLAQEIAEEM
ncbi:MAG: DUF2288 domain-containing protein [Pseudomonadota bacterium]|nr:DUF2288 domain-containing protein [Pseudomonadota bacterium]MDP1906482.1 DUF2288 domain-containing protein [Pseudomonadota bacterium]MDP2353001.1 DUF2288 domain-containing protein [Pseudomonadota bacterium]